MIVCGHFITDPPFENYLNAAWDRRGKPYTRERHTPMVRRWAPARFSKAQHATLIWSDWFGRMWIGEASRKRRGTA
jgi:hypothetical protein